jgi:membrane associated rhomboid family serine protease
VTTGIVTCYRHHDRRAGVACQRCGRPICPSCMVPASVGFHCPECARRGGQRVRTLHSRHARPVVTQLLIALNVLVFAVDLVAAGRASLWGQGYSVVSEQGLLVGAALGRQGQPIGVVDGEWWRIVTSGFLHAGLLHLGMNMFVLWILGSQLEPVLGRARFLALYITSLVAGAFGVLLVSPTVPTVGASGAIFGLLGAAFAAQKARGIDPWQSGIGGLLILNLVITFAVPGISIGGHVGGLIGGMVAGFVIFRLEEKVRSPVPALIACAVLTAVLWLGCLWAASHWADPVLGFLSLR